MQSAFGVEHISKRVPSGVRAGGGGTYGAGLRTANKYGKAASANMHISADKNMLVVIGRNAKRTAKLRRV